MYGFLSNGKNNGTKKPRRNIKVVSLFTGAGGLDLGFHAAGFKIIYANDIDLFACETLRRNRGRYVHKQIKISSDDIRDIDSGDLPQGIDFFIGGPPCQSFSAFGRRAGGAAGRLDTRGTLFEAYCRLLKATRPRGFLFENVRGILGTSRGRDWEAILNGFRKLGYHLSYRILDACDYGVPQHRERLFLVGQLASDKFLFPAPTHGPDSLRGVPHVRLRDAFKGLRAKREDLDGLSMLHGKYGYLIPEVPQGQNYLHFTGKNGYPSPVFAYRSRFSDFLYKADSEAPVKTIIASPGKYSGPFHWDNRQFTIAEYKRIQGFPDDYVVAGERRNVVKQIGNSVSPPIAYYLALAVAHQVFGRRANVKLMPDDYALSFDKRKGAKARKTRARHLAMASRKKQRKSHRRANLLRVRDYVARVEPTRKAKGQNNVRVIATNKGARLVVRADSGRRLFCKVKLRIFTREPESDSDNFPASRDIDVSAYGNDASTIQTMWNAVDDLIIRSTNYHSLIELYGHFTEPHPVFRIVGFEPRTKHPINAFAAHVAGFSNCSVYFEEQHLVHLFGKSFKAKRFEELLEILRGFRFDVRCNATNVAIPPGKYMVAYPFTLPVRKQMNFAHAQPGGNGNRKNKLKKVSS